MRGLKRPLCFKMPIYEFKCQDCGAVTEAQVPMNARNATLVCHCGGSAERIFSPVAISVDRGHHYNGKYRNKCESDLHKDTPYELAVKQWRHIKRMDKRTEKESRRFKSWEKTIKRQRKDKSVVRLLQQTERRQRERRQAAEQVMGQQI